MSNRSFPQTWAAVVRSLLWSHPQSALAWFFKVSCLSTTPTLRSGDWCMLRSCCMNYTANAGKIWMREGKSRTISKQEVGREVTRRWKPTWAPWILDLRPGTVLQMTCKLSRGFAIALCLLFSWFSFLWNEAKQSLNYSCDIYHTLSTESQVLCWALRHEDNADLTLSSSLWKGQDWEANEYIHPKGWRLVHHGERPRGVMATRGWGRAEKYEGRLLIYNNPGKYRPQPGGGRSDFEEEAEPANSSQCLEMFLCWVTGLVVAYERTNATTSQKADAEPF